MHSNRFLEHLTEKQPDLLFIKRILGQEAVLLSQSTEVLSAGIQRSCYDIIADTLPADPEEKTYLHFFPVEDGNYYLRLIFFPERNLKLSAENYRILQLLFQPEFFMQWPRELLIRKQPFRFDRSTEQVFDLPPSCYEPIHHLLQLPRDAEPPGLSEMLQRQESALLLLRMALDAFLAPDDANQLPACSFLNNSRERDKVMEAHDLILKNLEHPMTIRELARQVGINECYLKKGFKATFGKTIHEFQQVKRIEKAKALLKLGKHSINEVAFMMGFGSPSHFSSSFKKIAGMKPCELLG